MQNNKSFKQLLLKNSYLLVVAAWLITISFIIDNYWSGNSSVGAVKSNLSAYIHQQENDFDQIAGNLLLINKLVSKKNDEETLQKLVQKKYFLFIYKNNEIGLPELLFWNTQVIEPDGAQFINNSKSGFCRLVNGEYVWRKNYINGMMVVALIPVKWNYSIPNEYLTNTFVIGNGLENNYDITNEENAHSVKSTEGVFLFSVIQKAAQIIQQNNIAAVLLRLAAVLLALLFIHLTATYLTLRKFHTGVLFLIITISILRTISYYFPMPLNLRQFELFDPAVYGSNAILRSLGDLLINALLFLWVVLFIRHFIQEKNILIKVSNSFIRWAVILTGVVFLLICTFTCGHIFRSMVSDSQISFDVINFFTLNSFSIIGFIVLGTLAIGYFFLTQIIIYLIQPLLHKNLLVLLLTIAVTGLLILTFRINSPDVVFEICILVWLIIYLILLNNNHFFLLASQIISSRLIFWLFFFSLSITLIIVIENNRKELESRKNIAEALASKANPAGERLMNTVLTDFRNETLSPLFNRFKNDSTNQVIKDSLLNNNFKGYLNKYDTRIFTFDENESPLFNHDNTTFNTLTTIIKTQGKLTAVPDLFYYDVSYDKFTYISKKNITDSTGNLMGYIFIVATPKKYKTDALYPELFLKGYEKSVENSDVYSYAVYNKGRLVNSHNDYTFPSQLVNVQMPIDEFKLVSNKNQDELWYKSGSDKLVIIVKDNNISIESITLFSYLFCSFLFVTGIFWLLNVVIRSKLHWKELKANWQMSIRSQVHSTIIFISLISFLVIGVATILFFINRYHNNNKEKLSRTIHVMENELRNSLSEVIVFDDVIKVYDPAFKVKLEQLIAKISEVHAVDINLYDLDGNLKVSSLPLPYNKGIVGNKMDPVAFYHLNQLKEIQFFKEENIGTLNYLSNYVPVIDETGREYAYLNIPYFTSQTKLRQEISNFLVAIINLNAFIFLIAGIVAFFLTNRITSSFSLISNKMREVNLGKLNEAIVWKRKDEIGQLVNEYNKMVAKLDYSAVALAKSEREGAWREMAQQVAHEIKNPLTPMKLSLQYLQKAIDNKHPDIGALTKSVAVTLVEQIDHLNQIAGEFSQFANIGNAKKQSFDLNESVKMVIQLFCIKENLMLEWKPISG